MGALLTILLFIPVASVTVTSIVNIIYTIIKFKKLPKVAYYIAGSSVVVLSFWYLIEPLLFKDALRSFTVSFIIYPIPHAIILFGLCKKFKPFKDEFKTLYYSTKIQKIALVMLVIVAPIFVMLTA